MALERIPRAGPVYVAVSPNGIRHVPTDSCFTVCGRAYLLSGESPDPDGRICEACLRTVLPPRLGSER